MALPTGHNLITTAPTPKALATPPAVLAAKREAGTSLCYEKYFWQQHMFRPVSVGEVA
jgi:hypothetical protein